MDAQLQEVVKQIADAVEKRLSRRFDEIDARFEAVDARFDAVDARLVAVDARSDDFEQRFDARFTQAEKRLADQFTAAEARLTEQFTAAEKRLTEQFTAAEERLSDGAKAHMDELRTLVKLSAEGYGATLESLQRRLDGLEKKVDSGFADQGKMLRQHTLQLNALGRKQPTTRSSRR